jgi:hypothetical protein
MKLSEESLSCRAQWEAQDGIDTDRVDTFSDRVISRPTPPRWLFRRARALASAPLAVHLTTPHRTRTRTRPRRELGCVLLRGPDMMLPGPASIRGAARRRRARHAADPQAPQHRGAGAHHARLHSLRSRLPLRRRAGVGARGARAPPRNRAAQVTGAPIPRHALPVMRRRAVLVRCELRRGRRKCGGAASPLSGIM